MEESEKNTREMFEKEMAEMMSLLTVGKDGPGIIGEGQNSRASSILEQPPYRSPLALPNKLGSKPIFPFQRLGVPLGFRSETNSHTLNASGLGRNSPTRKLESESGVEKVRDDDNTGAPTSSGSENRKDEEEEPIEDLLESLSKDQLLILLKDAAERHRDVADRIRVMADEDPVHRKIFVHGLGWDTKAYSLIEAFKQYGEIEDCKYVFDKETGQTKGYGFILYKSRSGARNALKHPRKTIGTRMAVCNLASIGPGQGNHVTATANYYYPENVQRKIYVSNVSPDLDPQQLLEFFSRFGEIEEGPLGLDRSTGRPKGFTLFVYRSPEGAKKALEEPHKRYEGRLLHCRKANVGPKPANQYHHHHNSHNQNSRYQRNENTGNGVPGGNGNFIAGNNQAAQALNLAISQGAGLGLNQAFGQALLGTIGTASPGAAAGMPNGYGTQENFTPGMYPGYGAQGGYQGGYQTQQPGQGGSGSGQHGVWYGGPYMGH